MNNKKHLVTKLAQHIKSLGYAVYLAESNEYGFFVTPQDHVCSFEMYYMQPKFSGNYISSQDGTGWMINILPTLKPSSDTLKSIANAADTLPRFSPTAKHITVEQYLKKTKKYSNYYKF